MPIYVYETIPNDTRDAPRRFEVSQRMNDAPLRTDPDSGLPVRRLITSGAAIRISGMRRSTVVNKTHPAATPCRCTGRRPHRH